MTATPTSVAQQAQSIRQTLIDAAHVLADQGHGDLTRGHVSVRVPGQPDRFYMKPHSVGFDEVNQDNILTFDIEGVLVEGTARQHSERYIHSEVFRARPDVNAIVHTHPVHTVAFSATGRQIQASSQGGALFFGRLPSYTETINLIRSQEMGKGVAKSLGQHPAVLLRAHGLVMTGSSLPEAIVCCMMLEEACRIQLLVDAAGSDGWSYPQDDIERLQKQLSSPEQYTINFDYLVRQVRRKRG